jgi:hypothetical protein
VKLSQINAMPNLLYKLIIIFLIIFLIPQTAYTWGEMKHTMDEVLIHRLVLTDNYVFCGSNTSWGSNAYGLFIFDRKTETWKNYSKGNGFPSNSIKRMERVGSYIFIKTKRKDIIFDLNTGEYKRVDTNIFKSLLPKNALKIDNKIYKFVKDSIIIYNGEREKVYSFSKQYPFAIETKNGRTVKFIFSHPIQYNNKIYFAYTYYSDGGPSSYAKGIGSFNIDEGSFNLYPSDIFNGGNISGYFTHGNSIIFTTAKFRYEANAFPSVGFVKFSLDSHNFEIWEELNLSSDPLAILSFDEDELEYWIGTDKGVFRVNKKNRKSIHYGIRRGVIPKDSMNVYSSFDRPRDSKHFPIIARMNKGDTIYLIGMYNGFLEIKPPIDITGYVHESDVIFIKNSLNDSNYAKIILKYEKNLPEVKLSPDFNSKNMIRNDRSGIPYNREYIVVASVLDKSGEKWYKIKIPTAWIHSYDMVFLFEEIK